ncbi:MAG: asparagine synthase, partial [Anaerolineae bacterium]|nr:asparagine synthase [Anaerolineae bacterium]
MAGIVGIAAGGKQSEIRRMLKKIAHRGHGGEVVVDHPNATLGVVWNDTELANKSNSRFGGGGDELDGAKAMLPNDIRQEWRPFALAYSTDDGLLLARSRVGVRPLYYGKTDDGNIAYASEVKALLEVTEDIREFPPGSIYHSGEGLKRFTSIKPRPVRQMSPEQAAAELRQTLERSISRRVDQDVMGSWLSGGLDSSVIAALVRPRVKQLLTFAGGLPGAPDLESAREVAGHIGSTHHEVVVKPEALPDVLPEVVYALESFDALLVRSTVINYLVGKAVSEHVDSVFSGEGGDELFAGYDYLKELPAEQLQAELVDITNRLHNTALQRVDRSATSHGVVPHVPFLDPEVLDLALEMPSDLKLRPGNPPIE